MKTTFKNFTLTAQLYSSGEFFPNDVNAKGNGRHNQFQVFIESEKGSANFYFYDSTANYNFGINELSNEGLLNALYCFLSDSMAGRQEFEEFCGDLGYDTDSRRAYSIWEQCKESLDDLESGLELSYEEHSELLNELSELV